MQWLGRHWIPITLGLVGLVVFSAVAGSRVNRQSSDPHFALLADAWLNGRLDIDSAKKKGDDWAVVETAELTDGGSVRGRRLKTRRTFQIAGGAEIPMGRVKQITDKTYYVSFPPFPAVLMVPHATLGGHRGNDVFLTTLCAAAILPLMFLVLGRLRQAGLSRRSRRDDVWLTLAMGFGTVLFFSAVQGRVWFTAHVCGVALALGYVWCSVEARHPILAGLCLGLATMTRTPLAFMFPLFAFEAWRMAGAGGIVGLGPGSVLRTEAGRRRRQEFFSRCALFAIPILIVAALAMIHNTIRFGEPMEFGHSYLDVRQQRQMETIGMFSYDYLSRNLAVALTLLPEITEKAPYIKISGHGLAIWFTTPVIFWLLWPRAKNPWHRPLWITVVLVAAPTLLYQNSGWFQFGYRFSLDYLPFLIVLIAVGGRSLGRVGKTLIIAGIVINLFGAMTFARHYQFYKVDRATYNAVIKH